MRGRNVVLVNGWAMPGAVWQPFLDRSGVDPVVRFNMDEARSLAQWLEKFESAAPANATWIGWSLGGMLALAFAARYPERVNRLVLLTSTPCFLRKPDWPEAQSPELLENMRRLVSLGAGQLVRRFALLQVARESPAAKSLARQLSATLRDDDPVYCPEVLQSGLSLLSQMDLRDSFQRVSVPMLVVLGERDQVVKVNAEALRALNADVVVTEVAGMGHSPFLGECGEVVQRVMEFIEC